MAKVRRLSAVLLAAFVLVAMMFSLFTIVHDSCHECTGDNCPVCAVIAMCRNTLKTLRDALTAAVLVFVCFCFAASVPLFSHIAAYNQTPVSLKVMLLN